MSCTRKHPSGSFTTFRVLIVLGFTTQQALSLIWWATQIQIGQVILRIISLLQVTASHLVQVLFVGQARSSLLLLYLLLRPSIGGL